MLGQRLDGAAGLIHRPPAGQRWQRLTSLEMNKNLRVLLRVAIVVAVVLALIAVATSSRSGVLWRLSTFTYQANLLAVAYYVWTLVSPRADDRVGLRGAVVLYVVMAGVLWNLFLTGCNWATRWRTFCCTWSCRCSP